MTDNAAQHTLDWYRNRLGNITGSMVGTLMKAGRGKTFSDTTMSYLYQLAAERDMNPAIVEDDDLFQDYLSAVNVETRAMRFGTEQEANARRLYRILEGRKAVEVGSCRHPSIPHFVSSPDGFYCDEDGGDKGCLEIKCPTQAVYMKYRMEVEDGPTLKAVKPEYYWQCLAHMACCEARWTDFTVYCPFQLHPIHIVRIWPDDRDIRLMEDRVRLANETIDDIINQLKKK